VLFGVDLHARKAGQYFGGDGDGLFVDWRRGRMLLSGKRRHESEQEDEEVHRDDSMMTSF
jgi:hypothetical protein